MKSQMVPTTLKNRFYGLLLGSFMAWFLIATMMTIELAVKTKSPMAIFLYIYGIIFIPIAIILGQFVGQPIWWAAEKLGLNNRLAAFAIGILVFPIFVLCTFWLLGDRPDFLRALEITMFAAPIGGAIGLTSTWHYWP